MSIKNSLMEEFDKELKELGKQEVGSDKYKTQADVVVKLADRIIEIDRMESDGAIKWEVQDNERNLKERQLADEKRDHLIRNCMEGVKIGVGFGLAAWAFVASMNFEKEGTLTTEGGRTALRSLLKFIK